MKDMLEILTHIEKCMEQLRSACKELEEVGVVYHTVDCYKNPDTMNPTIYLSRGIMELATAFDKKVESALTDACGSVTIGGIRFVQGKLPVEREDRYA